MENRTSNPTYREIERRFLVGHLPELKNCECHETAQGYLTAMPVPIRLRSVSPDAFFLTVKRGAQENHEEREISLSKAQFDVLWPMTEGRRITKTRYRIPHENLVIELDVFHGKHAGLQIAEIEFPDPATASAFVPLAWFGMEVTRDIRYANVTLATE